MRWVRSRGFVPFAIYRALVRRARRNGLGGSITNRVFSFTLSAPLLGFRSSRVSGFFGSVLHTALPVFLVPVAVALPTSLPASLVSWPASFKSSFTCATTGSERTETQNQR